MRDETQTAGICTDEGAAILSRLLAVDTTNPPGNESALVSLILQTAGKDALYRIYDHGGGRSSLMLTIPGRDRTKRIGFAGHMDTVPVGDRGKWRHPPFGPDVENGVYYGRGAADMRGGLTAMLLLYRYYAQKEHTPPADLLFYFTADEEADGTGAVALRENGCFDGLSALFVCEPSDCRPGVAEKGTLWLEASVSGKTSHAAKPECGVNALETGFRFLLACKQEIEALAAGPLLGKSTFTVTAAESGVKINMIPDSARLLADIRITPDACPRLDALLAHLRAKADDVCAHLPGAKIDLRVLNRREALLLPDEHPFMNALRATYASVREPFEKIGIHFYTDASLIVPYTQVPFIILGPGDPNECHMADEKIALASIFKAFTLYQAFVERFCMQ